MTRALLTLALVGCAAEPDGEPIATVEPCADLLVDADLDGFATCLAATPACPCPDLVDCDDSDADVHPTRAGEPERLEAFDGVDDDCDGEIDEGWVAVYVDADDDGAPVADVARWLPEGEAEGLPTAPLRNRWDCDDENPRVFPGAQERPADGVDGDCDTLEVCYRDADGDGWGSGLVMVRGIDCDGPGTTSALGDCDDSTRMARPGLFEVASDGLDNDCDGRTDEPICVVRVPLERDPDTEDELEVFLRVEDMDGAWLASAPADDLGLPSGPTTPAAQWLDLPVATLPDAQRVVARRVVSEAEVDRIVLHVDDADGTARPAVSVLPVLRGEWGTEVTVSCGGAPASALDCTAIRGGEVACERPDELPRP